jgi:hypothetical protein
LRHFACDVISLAQSYFPTASEEDLLVLCRFFGKTISIIIHEGGNRTAIDSLQAGDYREIHNYEFASICFTTAMDYFERIQRECKNPTDAEMAKRNAVIFSIYSMRAEMAMDLQEKEVTYNLVTR